MLNKYSDNVYYSDYGLYDDRPVLGYIKGDRYALMVDAGNSEAHAREFLAEVEKKGLPKPDFVVLTHYHWDHTFGLSALDIPSFASEETYELINRAPKEWNNELFRKYCEEGIIEPFCQEHMAYEYPDFSVIRIALPTITFKEELKIDLGNQPVLFKKHVNPHSTDGVIVYAEKERVVFLGDSTSLELKGPDWIKHPDKLQKLYDYLETLDYDTCFHCHFDPIKKANLYDWLKDNF